MIQRIQTIWLLLAALTICCLLFLPIVTKTEGNSEYHIVSSGLYKISGNETTQVTTANPLLVTTIVVALMCLLNIFNFKNRIKQKRMIMVTIALIIGLSFWCSQFAKNIPGGLANAEFNFGTFLPIIAIFFCFLAIRGVNNDEKLVRSADRLR